MLNDHTEVWEEALSAAAETYDRHPSGKVFHAAMAALNRIKGNMQISESEVRDLIAHAKYSFGSDATPTEDFAQIKQAGLFATHRIKWNYFVPNPANLKFNFSAGEPGDIPLESMKSESQKDVIVYAAATIALAALVYWLMHRSRYPLPTSPICAPPEIDQSVKKKLILICRADGTVHTSAVEQLVKVDISAILNNIRFYAWGTESQINSNFLDLELSGVNNPYYNMLTFVLPAETNMNNFDNAALRGTELRLVLQNSQTILDDTKNLSALPKSEILKSYL